MKKFLKALDKNFERYLTIILLAWIIGWAFFQVISRFILKSIYWAGTEELVRYSYIWMIMLGGSLLTYDETHLKVDILNVIIGDKKNEYVTIFWSIVAIGVYALLTPYVWKWVYTTFITGKFYPSSNMPQFIFQASFLALCILCIIRNIQVIVRHVYSIIQRKKGDETA